MTAPQEANMTTLREAAKQALEALEHIQRCIGFATATIHQGSATWCQSEDAIASIKAALAQQAATKNCPQPEICGSKECEFCRDTAAPAPQAQEPAPARVIPPKEQQ